MSLLYTMQHITFLGYFDPSKPPDMQTSDMQIPEVKYGTFFARNMGNFPFGPDFALIGAET